MRVALTNYSHVSSIEDRSVIFELTFFKLVDSLTVSDQEYYLGSGGLQILIPSAKFEPSLHQFMDPAILINGAEVIHEVSIKVDSKWESMRADFGSFDAETMTLEINASTDAWRYLGNREISVAYIMQDLLEGFQLESTFTVLVHPKQASSESEIARPSFNLQGVSLIQEMFWGDAWEFKLPSYSHPDNIPARYQVDLPTQGQKFMSYDPEEFRIYIEQGTTNEDQVGSYRIVLELIDFVGVSSGQLAVSLRIAEHELIESEEASDGQLTQSDFSSIGDYYAHLL